MPCFYKKLSNLVKDEKVLLDFLEFTYNIHKCPWCLNGEDHSNRKKKDVFSLLNVK